MSVRACRIATGLLNCAGLSTAGPFIRQRCSAVVRWSSSSTSPSTSPSPSPLKARPVRRVVVTGLGLVTALGVGAQRTWTRLLQGHSGVSAITHADIVRLKLPSQVAACVPRGSAEGEFDVEHMVPDSIRAHTAPFVHFAVVAAHEALDTAGVLPLSSQDQLRAGVAVGSGVGDVEATYRTGYDLFTAGYKRVSPYYIPRMLGNMAAAHISMLHGLKGPNLAAATACTTGAHAIGDAFRAIQYGDADLMLAGGTEATINAISMAGFCRLRALSTAFNSSPATASRPFHADRDGFVIGEGAAVLCLEEFEHAMRRGATILAEISGYGMSSDAHHITAPVPDGDGAYRCMSNALRDAGLQPPDIDYINAHATSTPAGDIAECRAIHRLFSGVHAERPVSVSSTKGAVGHCLGAAGAIEAALCVLALRSQTVPGTLNLSLPRSSSAAAAAAAAQAGVIDSDCIQLSEASSPDSSSPPARSSAATGLHFITATAEQRTVRHCLTNSFGFGGTNASLVISAAPSTS